MKHNMLTNSTHNWAIYKVIKIDLTASKSKKSFGARNKKINKNPQHKWQNIYSRKVTGNW